MVYDIDECGNMILENLTVKCDKLYLSLIRLIFPHISFTSATNIEIFTWDCIVHFYFVTIGFSVNAQW